WWQAEIRRFAAAAQPSGGHLTAACGRVSTRRACHHPPPLANRRILRWINHLRLAPNRGGRQFGAEFSFGGERGTAPLDCLLAGVAPPLDHLDVADRRPADGAAADAVRPF